MQNEGKQLSKADQDRFDELNKDVQPAVQKTFEVNKALYDEAKVEVEKIASNAIRGLKASLSPFPIKRPSRASVKTIRWYGAFTERLGDGARVNVVVHNGAVADKVLSSIDRKHPVAEGEKYLRRVSEITELGYPKRLIVVRTSSGVIAEIQVITTDGYLAKDGLSGFTGDQKQKDSAAKALEGIKDRLGWPIPDGLGHYFYKIHRDVNVDDNLREEALELSNSYYDAFTNPESTLDESFMDEVIAFKEQVDATDKTNWDKGNEGKPPVPLANYINQEIKDGGERRKRRRTDDGTRASVNRGGEDLYGDSGQDRPGDARDASAETPSYGKAREGAVSYVGRHYSKQPREYLDSSQCGTNVSRFSGGESSRLRDSSDNRINKRIYFYINTDGDIKPELGVGGFAHEVRLDNLYDHSSKLIE